MTSGHLALVLPFLSIEIRTYPPPSFGHLTTSLRPLTLSPSILLLQSLLSSTFILNFRGTSKADIFHLSFFLVSSFTGGSLYTHSLFSFVGQPLQIFLDIRVQGDNLLTLRKRTTGSSKLDHKIDHILEPLRLYIFFGVLGGTSSRPIFQEELLLSVEMEKKWIAGALIKYKSALTHFTHKKKKIKEKERKSLKSELDSFLC